MPFPLVIINPLISVRLLVHMPKMFQASSKNGNVNCEGSSLQVLREVNCEGNSLQVLREVHWFVCH